MCKRNNKQQSLTIINTVNTRTYITKTAAQLSKQPLITKPTYTHTHKLRTHNYTHSHITKHTHTHTLQDIKKQIKAKMLM